MKSLRTLLALPILMLLPAQAGAATAIDGLWLTENKRSVIKIEECEHGVCGDIHWIIDGGMQFDSKNPDKAKRDRPMCGLTILWGFEQDDENEWEDGKIYKADEGDIYSSELELEDDDTLEVTGYIGFSFIGKSQIWTRVDAEDYPACTPAEE